MHLHDKAFYLALFFILGVGAAGFGINIWLALFLSLLIALFVGVRPNRKFVALFVGITFLGFFYLNFFALFDILNN